jgi:hypothetical protein
MVHAEERVDGNGTGKRDNRSLGGRLDTRSRHAPMSHVGLTEPALWTGALLLVVFKEGIYAEAQSISGPQPSSGTQQLR